MAWVPPKSGAFVCERCSKTSVTCEGWIRLEQFDEGHLEAARTLDYCTLCKVFVMKTLRSVSTSAVRDQRW